MEINLPEPKALYDEITNRYRLVDFIYFVEFLTKYSKDQKQVSDYLGKVAQHAQDGPIDYEIKNIIADAWKETGTPV